MRAGNYLKWVISFTVAALLFAGCAAIQEKLGSLKITQSDADAIVKTTKALRKSFSEITEEEEYYIGRAVSALILSKYKVYQNSKLTAYVNQVGNAVTIYSDRPETFAGYHFLILDSSEVNALAAPGGFVFVTKGLLKRCKNEEMLGCILAHEVGHVSAKHGLRSIKKSRLIDAFKIIGQEVGKKYGPQELSQLTELFENVLGDIAEKLIERGYDRKYEYEADRLGIRFAAKTGYAPGGLLDFLKTMSDEAGEGSDKGWYRTHPSPQDRLKQAEKESGKLNSIPSIQKVRTTRFNQAISTLK